MLKKRFLSWLKKPENKYFFASRFSAARIAFLGMYLAILVTLKYLLGFIVGIELVTFMFVIAGLFFPVKDGIILVVAFNLLVIAMYGFGTWELMYWVLWPVDFLGAKLLSKITRSKFIIAIWGFICGLSLIWWYFLSDLYFFGTSFAIANIISAIPVNLIEGFVTVFMIFLCGGAISKLFSAYSLQLWNISKPFVFKEYKHEKVQIGITIFVIISMLFGIVLLFIYNDFFLELKAHLFSYGEATKI